ncbi:MAG: hypothetical protein QNK11_07470, partial [Legionella sp.]|nr:hypothetical protein [Legionella sp.]
ESSVTPGLRFKAFNITDSFIVDDNAITVLQPPDFIFRRSDNYPDTGGLRDKLLYLMVLLLTVWGLSALIISKLPGSSIMAKVIGGIGATFIFAASSIFGLLIRETIKEIKALNPTGFFSCRHLFFGTHTLPGTNPMPNEEEEGIVLNALHSSSSA